MGDLDTSLIREFSLVPAFYNKASPHFKDKPFIEEAWTTISQKLGYDGKKYLSIEITLDAIFH